jgi:hypothetical protein
MKLYIIVQVYVDGMPTMSSKERKASLREFYGLSLLWFLVNKCLISWSPHYFQFQLLNASDCKFLAAVIYPSLRQLEGEFIELEDSTLGSQSTEILARKRAEGRRKLSDNDLERDEECGICMENCTRMVLPSCGHALCNRCFHDW